MKTKLALTIALCTLLFAASAFAGDDPRKAKAGALHQEAVAALNAKHVDEALAKFKEAYDVFPAPNTLFGVARCEHLLGQALPAIRHYREALRNPLLNLGSQSDGKKFISELEQQLGRIQVDAPSGATISVDGTVVEGIAPFSDPLDVQPGKHIVEMHRENEAARAEVDVGPGHVATVKLEPTNAAHNDGVPHKPVEESYWLGGKIATTVVLGTIAVAGFIMAPTFGALSDSAASDANTLRASLGSSGCYQVTSATCSALHDKTSTRDTDATASRIFWVVGPVLAAATVAVILFWPNAKRVVRASATGFSIAF